MNSSSSDLAIAVAIIRTTQGDSLEVQSLGADVLLVRPLDCAEGEIYLFEIAQVLQFTKDFVIQIRLGIESLDTAIIELQVQGEIVVCCHSDDFIHAR